MKKMQLGKVFALAACLLLAGNLVNAAEPDLTADNIQYQLTEKVPNEELRQLLVDYYDIPEQYLRYSYYFYNYADLNNDGSEEIFAMVAGPYTSGSGGSSAVLAERGATGLRVKKSFTLVRNPVIISKEKHNGYNDLIFYYSGGGAQSGYRVIAYQNGNYQNINDGAEVESFSGQAIMADEIDLYRNYGFDLTFDKTYYTLQNHKAVKVKYPEITDHKGVLTSEYANYSLRQTAFNMLSADTDSVDYYVMCNDGKMLSVVYEARQNDGTKILTALNMEMQRANEIKKDNAFTDFKALSALLNINEDILANAQCYVDGKNFVFLYPTVRLNAVGYEIVKRPYQLLVPYLYPDLKKYFTNQ